ncbi:unnamed protein product [Mytilus coruscus]|uniref:Uncharacterized protein n=1 Tax=Mytilus coruscus TaxID=42192 RepID=A0A6J8CZ94_MYTCO|nr:unnamed protein product [Mytilus coruscus]
MEKGLKSLSRHPFGDHSMCNKSWCHFVTNQQEVYKSLLNGKHIQDQKLKETLTEVFDLYINHAEKLASLGSTQANESFNKTVGSKAPKSHHYSGSASLNYRVTGSVLQKNIGYTYVSLVHKRMGLSSGAHTMCLAKLKDLQSRKRRAIATTRKVKIKRLALKSKKSKSYAASISEH